MNTPTPEDIALATHIAEETSQGYNAKWLAQLIADHCAPLRERIARQENTAAMMAGVLKYLGAPESLPDDFDALGWLQGVRELAEIGRLAVEHRRMLLDRNTTIRACGHARVTMDDACDAYLAKEPKV